MDIWITCIRLGRYWQIMLIFNFEYLILNQNSNLIRLITHKIPPEARQSFLNSVIEETRISAGKLLSCKTVPLRVPLMVCSVQNNFDYSILVKMLEEKEQSRQKHTTNKRVTDTPHFFKLNSVNMRGGLLVIGILRSSFEHFSVNRGHFSVQKIPNFQRRHLEREAFSWERGSKNNTGFWAVRFKDLFKVAKWDCYIVKQVWRFSNKKEIVRFLNFGQSFFFFFRSPGRNIGQNFSGTRALATEVIVNKKNNAVNGAWPEI